MKEYLRRSLHCSVAFLVASTAFGQSNQTAADGSSWQAEIVKLEQKMWDLFKARQIDGMWAMMAPDIVTVDANGVAHGDAIIKTMKKRQCSISSVSLTETKVTTLAPEVILISYRANPKGTCDGKPLTGSGDVMSSIWAKRSGKWLTVFHQESPAAQ